MHKVNIYIFLLLFMLLFSCKDDRTRMQNILTENCDCSKIEMLESEGSFTYNLYHCKKTKPHDALMILNALQSGITNFCDLKEYTNIVFITGHGTDERKQENIFRHCLVSFQF